MQQTNTYCLNEKGQDYIYKETYELKINNDQLSEQIGLPIAVIERFEAGYPVREEEALTIFDYFNISPEDIESYRSKSIGKRIRRRQDSLPKDYGSQFANERLFLGINSAARQLSHAPKDDIQAIAAAQIKILDSYYREVLNQSQRSFNYALWASIAGLLLFIAAMLYSVNDKLRNSASIPLISGAIVEVLAGINFYLYGQTTMQLKEFHQRLDKTQRFLLANSMCEGLEGDAKQSSRSELIERVSAVENLSKPD
jgi:hypothetical protein